MFFLKILFILLLIAFILLLAYTAYNKITHPEKPLMKCLPFAEDFSNSGDNSTNVIIDGVAEKPAPIKASNKADDTSETIVTLENTEVQKIVSDEVKAEPIAQKTSSKPTTKKPIKTSKANPKTKKPTVKKTKSAKKKGDNIKKINGIGPVFEKKLNSIGINKFEHIAAWSASEMQEIDEQLELSGRPQREEWISKAKILAAEKNA